MAITIYLALVVFITGFLVDVLPFLKIIKTVSELSKKSVATIQSTDLDDDAKQKALLSCSVGIFKESFKIAFYTLLIFGVVYVLFWLSKFFPPLSEDALIDYSITWTGIIVSLVAFFIYFFIKKLYVKYRV